MKSKKTALWAFVSCSVVEFTFYVYRNTFGSRSKAELCVIVSEITTS
jgi:hypothetical protein